MKLRAKRIDSLKLLVSAAYILKSTRPCQVYGKCSSCTPLGEVLELHTFRFCLGPQFSSATTPL